MSEKSREKVKALKKDLQVIEDAAVKSYKAIETGTVGAYKAIETAVVGTYKKIEDEFVDTFLREDGETIEEAKKRINGQLNDHGRTSDDPDINSHQISQNRHLGDLYQCDKKSNDEPCGKRGHGKGDRNLDPGHEQFPKRLDQFVDDSFVHFVFSVL